MAEYDVFCEYIALKNHFNSKSYDYFKYSGKIKIKPETFQKRNDRIYFKKLLKNPDHKDFLLANLIHNRNFWIGEIQNSESSRVYKVWKKRNQSLSYLVELDLRVIQEECETIRNAIEVKYSLPKILSLYLSNKICIETLVLFTKEFRCLNYWRKELKDSPLFPEIDLLISKYYPFITQSIDIKNICRKINFSLR